MIKLVRIDVGQHPDIRLSFSDGTNGIWSAADLIARETVMTRPLADPNYFARAFIEGGALAWPNGFELSATSLHRRMDEGGTLMRTAA